MRGPGRKVSSIKDAPHFPNGQGTQESGAPEISDRGCKKQDAAQRAATHYKAAFDKDLPRQICMLTFVTILALVCRELCTTGLSWLVR